MPGPLAHTRSLSKWLKFSSSNTETKKSSDAGHSDFGVLDEKAAQAHQYSVRPGLAIHSHSLPAREAPRAPRRSARDIHSFSDGSLYNTNDPRHAAYTYYPARPTALSDIGHITATYSPTNIPPSIISSSPSPPPSSSSPSSAHPYSKSSNPLPNPVPDPLPTYQNLPSSYSNRSNSHVSGPSSPNVHTPPSQITLPNTAILSQKPLPPLPSPPPLTPAWDNDSSVGHGYAFTDAGHYSAVTAPLPEIGHHYITSAWTDAGHDTDDFRPYDDLDKPQPTFANTPASSSSTLSVPNPRRRSIFGRKAHSDIGHGHHPSSTSQSAGSQLGDTHVPASATESACPPSFSRHFFLASSSNQTDPSSSQHRPRKLRKQPRSASASRIDLPDITVSDCGHASSSMDVTNVRPASLVVSPMGPPMMSLGKAPGYQDKRPPPLAIPSGKENTRSKQESKPRKPSLIRRWTLNRAAASSSSASASASNEGSVSSAQDASVSTPVTTPDSGEMEFRWSGQAVSESGHGYGKWFTGKRARDSVLSMSESTVASPRASTSVSAFSGETATTRGSGGIAGQGAQMVGGRRVSRKLTKRRRPSVGQGQATPITPATPATSTTVFVTSPTSIDASTADVRSPSSTSLGHGWTSGGESRGRDNASSHSKRRKLKKRSRSRRPARTPASPSEFDLDTGYLSSPEYSEGHYQQNNWNRHPHPYSLDLSSSSYAAASAAMSPISVLPMSPAFSSSRLSLGKGSNKGKSRSRLAVDLTDDMPPRSSGEEIGGWDPYLKAKGKGKQKEVLERRILEPGEYALPADTGERERLKGLSPPPRVKRESVDGDASGRSTPEGGMRRWTMAFGDEDEEEASSGPVRVRTNTKTSGRSRSRAGSAVMSMMSWPEGSTTDGGYPSTLSGVDGEGDDGLQMEEMGVVGMGIALTTSPSMEGSLQSGTRWRCSYNPRGSGMVYGVQDDDDDEEDDEEEDEVWGEGREEWLEIRKVKMCCRELVRTERNYLRCLRDLMGGETQTLPSPLLLAYLPSLLTASNSFLAHLTTDPTPYGVSAAFLGCEDELEAAFVAWCGIVGSVFAETTPPPARGRKGGKDGFTAKQRAKSGFFGQAEDRPSSRSVSYVGAMNVTGDGMFTAALGSGLKFPLAPLNVNAVTVPSKKSASSWRKSMPALSNLVILPGNGGTSHSNASTLRIVGKRKQNKSGSTFFLAA